MNLLTPDSRTEVPYVGIEDALRHVRGELNLYTYDQRRVGDDRVQWPFKGVFVIHMTNLPEECHELITRIIGMLEATDENNFVSFPVKSVEIRQDDDLIVVIGDEKRIDKMRPMPS